MNYEIKAKLPHCQFESRIGPFEMGKKYEAFIRMITAKESDVDRNDLAQYVFVPREYEPTDAGIFTYHTSCVGERHPASKYLAIFLAQVVCNKMTLEFISHELETPEGYFVYPGYVYAICYSMIDGDCIYDEEYEEEYSV